LAVLQVSFEVVVVEHDIALATEPTLRRTSVRFDAIASFRRDRKIACERRFQLRAEIRRLAHAGAITEGTGPGHGELRIDRLRARNPGGIVFLLIDHILPPFRNRRGFHLRTLAICLPFLGLDRTEGAGVTRRLLLDALGVLVRRRERGVIFVPVSVLR
jgi:hypothetical protein